MRRRLALAIAALAIAAPAKAGPRPLVLATYAYPRYDRAQALQPMADHLAKVLRRPVRVSVAASPDALADDLRAGRADVAATNLAAFLAVADEAKIRPAAMFDVPAAILDGYRGVLLARAGESLRRAPADPPLRYVRVIPGSTSGALVQQAWLKAQGQAVLADAGFAGTHEAAAQRLLDGSADLAALAEEAWRNLKSQRPADAARLTLVWRSEPIPPGPIVCAQSADLDCAAVAKALTASKAHGPAQAMAAAWAETAGARRLVAADPAVYAPFQP